MSYTTPATAVAGTVLTAAFLNTNVRDNVAWLATDSPAVRAYNNANISLANATNTAITMNSERFDNAGMHSTSSSTERLVVPTGAAGKYLFGGNISFAFSGTGSRGHHCYLNGATIICENTQQASSSVGNEMSYTSIYALAVADYIAMIGYQNSGGALNTTSNANYSPEFWAYWLRT